MKHGMKCFFSIVLFVAVFIMVTPENRYYAAVEFTYAEQNTKKKVTELEMSPGEKKDLCFIGVTNSYNYTCTWFSSNEEVASVDKKGVITAKSQGTTEIILQIGDGTDYISESIKVTVISMNLTIGTSSNREMNVLEVKNGDTKDLNFYGITDWGTRKSAYLTEWISCDESIVTVEQSTGVITAKNKGITIIYFQLYDLEKHILLTSSPVVVVVGE